MLVAKAGQPNPQALPGATQASVGLYVIGVGVSLIILALETFGEMGLGIAAEQSNVAWFFIITSLAAGIIEEIIFRGFLVIENRGQKLLIVSCVVFSAVFALLHPYLWQLNYPEGVEMWEFQKANFNITLTTKAIRFGSMRFALVPGTQTIHCSPACWHTVPVIWVFLL